MYIVSMASSTVVLGLIASGVELHRAAQYSFGFLSIFRGNVRAVEPRQQGRIATKSSFFQLYFATLYDLVAFLVFFTGVIVLNEAAHARRLGIVDLLYYTFVTLSTVGYGDITLSSVSGRALSCVFILAAMIFVPLELNNVIKKLRNELPKITIRRNIHKGIITIGPKDLYMILGLREVFPKQQQIQQIVIDENVDYDEHPDLALLKRNINRFDYVITKAVNANYFNQLALSQGEVVIVYSNPNATQ